MAQCECLPKCPFFNDKMKNMSSTADLMKQRYCLSNNSTCARFMIFKAVGREKVPANLFPNQIDKAKRIIEAG